MPTSRFEALSRDLAAVTPTFLSPAIAFAYGGGMRRAVLFDLFNTLVPGGADDERREVAHAMGEALGADPEAYARAFYESWPERFVASLGDLASTVRAIAVRVGGSPTEEQIVRATELRRGLTAGLMARVSPATLATLDHLRTDGWLLGVVSNTTPEAPDCFHESPLAGRFDATAFSSELGVAKPDPGIYRAVCRMLEVSCSACVYVGDGADKELAAAAALGMRTIRTTEHADTDPAWTGEVVGTIADVLADLS